VPELRSAIQVVKSMGSTCYRNVVLPSTTKTTIIDEAIPAGWRFVLFARRFTSNEQSNEECATSGMGHVISDFQ